MSDDVEKCENNVESEQCHKIEWDRNSSSGGSVYQEFHVRQEEGMYSTDDEFVDATETIRSPLLTEDPEEQLSAPILKQLRQEKEQTRYLVVDMVTESESVNNVMQHCKRNFETAVKHPSREKNSDYSKREKCCIQSSETFQNVTEQQSSVGLKPEKNKCSRTLRLPSSVALPTVKPDRPARGDGRPPIGTSKIPLPVSSMTKLQVSATTQQNSSESESCHRKLSKQSKSLRTTRTTPTETPERVKQTEDEVAPECLNEMNTSASVPCHPAVSSVPLTQEPTGPITQTPPSRSSVRPGKKQFTKPSSRPLTRPSLSTLPKEDKMDTGDENMNKNAENEQDPFTPIDASLVSSTSEGAETKRMRVANKPPSREEPERRFGKSNEPSLRDPDKRKREIQAVRHRLAQDRLNLINSRERSEVSGKQSQTTVDSYGEQKNQDPIKSENTQRSSFRKLDNNGPSTPSRAKASPSYTGSDKNTQMLEKVPSSPRQLSPTVMNMTIAEKRRQWRQSGEAANGDQKLSIKNTNMPEIKPSLFRSNQLKTNQLGQRYQENIPNGPMKSALEDESLKRKTTLVEKRKMMMKQKEAGMSAHKPPTGDAIAQRTGKCFERASREKPPLLPNQKRSNSDIRKQPTGIPKSTEKTTSLHSNVAIQDVQEEFVESDIPTKPSTTSTNAKVTLASMQNVYKMHYKRCEEQLSEVKRAKDKLSSSLEKIESIRNQMIQKFGEDAEEYIPPLYIVQTVIQDSPTVMTTAKGTNTEVLEEVAESLVLRGNNQQLKHDIEILRKQLEDAKEIGDANKKDDDVIQDLKQRIREMSLTLTLAEKRQQTLEDKMEEKQKEIISLSNENKQMNDLSRQRDQQLAALRKQIEEKNRELESIHKKLNEANSNLQQELYKRELSHIEHQKLVEDKTGCEKALQEMDSRFADFEEREECLNTILENEKKKNMKLEELLNKREDELSSMEKKFFVMESSSSNNMMVINDQLQEKNTVIQELQIIKTTLLGQIRELCCLLSDMFALRGIEYNTDHIQASVSAGSIPVLREELIKVMEERIEESNKAINEARSKIIELQNQVKILQIELEDSKMMSERLSNVITHQKPWDADRPWEEHQRTWSPDMESPRYAGHNNVDNSVQDNKSFRDMDKHCMMPSINNPFISSDAAMDRNNFNELFLLLERKRRQLLQLERKYQDMEEVHSHCAQKRTRNETRIAQLEMMLATTTHDESGPPVTPTSQSSWYIVSAFHFLTSKKDIACSTTPATSHSLVCCFSS
ncbi:putative leucine-rich repeat-containing protein DDB_G0290503 isoform X4 [Halyomorpha halys]|uniref:putative leucine-rich repeat-containing protein DDB_G0290503 isoform X4 n=1 Tax=Halyomorpha halys TaxID=286706 RepID=UPI0034D213D1